MGLVATACPACGASIEVPDNAKGGYCVYCGAHVVSEAWLNRTIIEHTGTVTVQAPQFEITAGVLTRYTGHDADVVIPDNVTTIEQDAFRDTQVRSVYLPASLKTLKTCAFAHCEALTTIRLADGFGASGFDLAAFYDCKSLQTIVVEGDLGEGIDLFHVLESGTIRFHGEPLFQAYRARVAGTGLDPDGLNRRLERLNAQRREAGALKRSGLDKDIAELQRRLSRVPDLPKLVLVKPTEGSR
ncbi:MAG: leucine-rich repeat domain-containing protein [Coriobacteriia bacterium]|nr:leucine-rich repeat domain-containing protein [Coriobacteriia bacterium]